MDTLPVEIILMIVSYVSDIRDRVRLLRVCRRWRDLFFHIAYARVDIDGSLIRPLTKVALAHPRIGAAIHDLSLMPWDSNSYVRYKDLRLPEAVEELVGQISTTPDEQKYWTEELRWRNEGAWLALLLTLVPNLVVLSGHYCYKAPRVTQVVARVARKEPPFDTRPALQRLKTLHITSDDLKTYYPHWQFLPFFHLPSLRDVNLRAVKEIEPFERLDDPAVSSASGTSPAESLVLEVKCNGRKGMAEFITSCANLKQLKYQHDPQEIWGVSSSNFQPRKFYRALLTQKHSLEVLHLSDTGGYESGAEDLSDDEEDDGPEAYDRWFGSLAEFSQLQDLRIRVQHLLNYHNRDRGESVALEDILPRSLRSLHVAECWEKHCAMLVPNLQGVLDHREQFPNLERIGISSREAEEIPPGPNRSPWPRHQYRVPESFEKLFVPVRDMCHRVGITFEMSVWVCSVA